jgi:transcriptional regulator with XRE-family HTH domain
MAYHRFEEEPESEPTLASAIRLGRMWTKQPLRRLAKTSGVSTAQLSRLEAGQVERPSIETLFALAAALNLHPTPLLILGRQLEGKRAKEALRQLFEQSADGIAAEYGPDESERLLSRLEGAKDEELLDLASHAITLPVPAVDWPASLAAAAPASAPDADLFREVTDAWRELTPDRRWRLVELVRDLRHVSQLERQPDVRRRR